MKKSIILVLAGIAGGCGGREVIFEMYSEIPVTPTCAEQALASVDELGSVTIAAQSIVFSGGVVEGELFHGTEGEPFTTYGLAIHSSQKMGKKISSAIADALASHCSSSAQPALAADPHSVASPLHAVG